MRKFLALLAAGAPAVVLASTGANALECYPRTADPAIYDCYSDSGAFAYSTREPRFQGEAYPGPRVRTRVYGWSSEDAAAPRFYAPPRAGQCGAMRYWSWSEWRCVDARGE